MKHRPQPSYPWKIMVRTQIFAMSWQSRRPVPDQSPTNRVRIRAWLSLKLVGDWSATNQGPLRDLTEAVTLTLAVWYIIKIQFGSEELWLGHGFLVLGMLMHCDLDIKGMTLGQGHATPLGHGQKMAEILSGSNLAVRSYGPDTDLGYVCTVTLTLEIWPLVKVMTNPGVIDNNCLIYYPDPT